MALVTELSDKQGNVFDIAAKRFEVDKHIVLDGDITGEAYWNAESGMTIEADIKNNTIGTNELQDNAVTTGKISNGAVTLEKIADAAKNGTIQDNDNKLATHAQVKTYVDASIAGQGTYLGKMTVAEINALDSSTLRNSDRVMTSDAGTITLGGFDVIAGTDLILYKDGSTITWDSMDGNFKTKQDEVEDPEADGTSLEFISNISQNKNGDITVQKKSVDLSNVATKSDIYSKNSTFTLNTFGKRWVRLCSLNPQIRGGTTINVATQAVGAEHSSSYKLTFFSGLGSSIDNLIIEGIGRANYDAIKKFRIVRKGNATLYIDAYVELQSATTNFYFYLGASNEIVKSQGLNGITLYDEDVEASIPEGYSTKIYELNNTNDAWIQASLHGNADTATLAATAEKLKPTRISSTNAATLFEILTYNSVPAGGGILSFTSRDAGNNNIKGQLLYAYNKVEVLVEGYSLKKSKQLSFYYYQDENNFIHIYCSIPNHSGCSFVLLNENPDVNSILMNNTVDALPEGAVEATYKYNVAVDSAKGSTSVPVYVDANGNVQACTTVMTHVHNANDITSGVLPINRGGTGVQSKRLYFLPTDVSNKYTDFNDILVEDENIWLYKNSSAAWENAPANTALRFIQWTSSNYYSVQFAIGNNNQIYTRTSNQRDNAKIWGSWRRRLTDVDLNDLETAINECVKTSDVLQEMNTSSVKPIAAQAVNAAIQNAIGGQATFGGEKTIAELNAIMAAGNVPSGTYYIVGGTSSGRLNNPDGTYIEVDPGNQVTLYNPEGTESDKWYKNSAGKANDNTLGLVKTSSENGGVSLNDSGQMLVNGWADKANVSDVDEAIAAAESNLSGQISEVNEALESEVAAREDADTTLQSNINTLNTSLDGALSRVSTLETTVKTKQNTVSIVANDGYMISSITQDSNGQLTMETKAIELDATYDASTHRLTFNQVSFNQ